ncbi:hypothetical protein [Streptomyces sp. NPDC055400]
MEIELLVVPGCPRQQLAEELLRQALATTGLAATGFRVRVVADQAEAEWVGFIGSPTILINGRTPFAEPGTVPAHACRVYATAAGPDGCPAAYQLRKALIEAMKGA